MKIISCISQKGGVGKTTISINVAIAATLVGKQVVILDLDPQQSASRWSRLRSQDNPIIIPAHAPNLAEFIEQARKHNADLVVIDTAPKSENAALSAAKLANFIIIPTQASNLDLDAIADTIQIVELAKKPAAFVLTNCKTTSSLADMAADALSAYSIPLAPIRFANRVAFVKSLMAGKGVIEFEPNGPSAKEAMQLYKYICKQGGM